MKDLTKIQHDILNVAAAELKHSLWLSGKKLRSAFPSLQKEIVIESTFSLVPQYLVQQGEIPDDNYHATLHGVMQSRIVGLVSGIVEATLDCLRRLYSTNPDMRRFSWEDLLLHKSLEFIMVKYVDNILVASGLASRGQGNTQPPPLWVWDVPPDIEDVVGCQNINEYMELRKVKLKEDIKSTAEEEDSEEPISEHEVDLSVGIKLRNEILGAIRLHATVYRLVHERYIRGDYQYAVLDVCKDLVNRVRQMSELQSLDGKALMAKALRSDDPIIKIVPIENRFDKNEQEGWMFLFMGAMTAIRNGPPHEDIEYDDNEATEILSFLSLLYRKLDQSKKR